MPDKKPTISIKKLSKHYGKLRAVDRLSLEVREGEVFALLGPNGAGKTTIISMLCGLLRPTSGKAYVAGHDVEKEPLRVRQSIGVVFQQPSVDDLLSGRENLQMHALLYGMPREGRKERIDGMLELVGLSERQHSRVKEYSGGMRKRLEIARGILHRPKILFLDEPTVGLDPQTRQHIWHYIKKMSERENTTIVFTTHYLEEAEQYADMVAIIDHGKIIANGRPRDLIAELGGDVTFLKTRQPQKLAAKIRRMPFAKNVKVEKDGVRISLLHSNKNLPKMLKQLEGIEAIDIHPATLNDIFIKYTGRQMRDDDAEGEGSYWERIMNDRANR